MEIINSINRLYFSMMVSELRELSRDSTSQSLTYNSVMYLQLIAYKEACTVSYLSRLLHLSKSAVTIKVNELVRQGLVRRVQSDTDKRVYYLYADEAVLEANATYDKVLEQATKKIEKEFPREKIEAFCEILEVFDSHFAAE